MERTGEQRRDRIAREEPDLADDLARGRHRPARPDVRRARDHRGRRTARSSSRYLGRGHTDHDIVIDVPGADVLFAGDLVEQGNVPFFGDGYPLDWVATADALVAARERRRRAGPRRPRRPGVRRRRRRRRSPRSWTSPVASTTAT